MCTMIRTFHPVGQGLFCTERFENQEGKPFNIVYDCGSKDPGRKHVEGMIPRVFSKGDVIDALYISHFDADHVNAIPFLLKHCTVKRIYLPFLEGCDEAAYWMANYISGTLGRDDGEDAVFTLIRAAAQEESTMVRIEENETAVIPVHPIFDDGQVEDVEPLSGPDTSANVLRPYGNTNSRWIFLPFNYLRCRRRRFFASVLSQELKKLGQNITTAYFLTNPRVVLARIGSIDDQVRWFSDVNQAIQKEFVKNKAGNVNDNSMVLYSGIEGDLRTWHWSRAIYYGVSCQAPYNQHHSLQNQHSFGLGGCLYCGDYNAKNSKYWKGLTCFYQHHNCWSGIECVVLPHHGAGRSFNDAFCSMQNSSFVASYGLNNTYKHPSISKMAALRRHRKIVFTVNEYDRCEGRIWCWC